jgi:peptidyl-prolyl cis-trans isomerase SurA
MKRLLIGLCLILSLPGVRAEVLDRIVAVVDGHIITTSDMRQEREILMRLGEKPIADDKALVRHMVDNYLMETGIADFPGVDITDTDIDAELKNSVALEGVPSQAVREAVRLRLRMRKYFDMRFRQYIRVSDEDIRKYYSDVFLPAAAEKHLNPVPPLDQVTELIRSNVVEERLNHEIDIWLEAIHRRSSIEIFE